MNIRYIILGIALLINNTMHIIYPMECTSQKPAAAELSQPPRLVSLALQKLPLDALIKLESMKQSLMLDTEINTFDCITKIVPILQTEGVDRLIHHPESIDSLLTNTATDQKITHALIHENPVTKFVLQKELKIHAFTGHKNTITALNKNPYNNHLAVASIGGGVRIWDTKTKKCITEYLILNTLWINAISWSTDGRCACATVDGTIHIKDIQKNEGGALLPGNTQIQALDWQHNILVSGDSDGTICIWDTNTYECIKTIQAHKKEITSIVVNRDVHQCISAAKDGTLFIWDLNTYECIAETYTTSPVTCATIQSEHHLLAVGTDDGNIQVWDLETDACIALLPGHMRRVNSIIIVDAHHLISASDNGTIYLWNMVTGANIDLSQRTINIATSSTIWTENNGQLFIACTNNTTVHTVQVNMSLLYNLSLHQALLFELFRHEDALKKTKKHNHLTTIFYSLSSELKKVLDPHGIIPTYFIFKKLMIRWQSKKIHYN